jgi:hypothetical protein
MIMPQFDKTEVLDKFVNSLRNKRLLPKPHLGVLETKWPEDSSGTFTFSDRPASQNLIGYDFQIESQGTSPKSISNLKFWVRSGNLFSSEEKEEEAFTPIIITIISDLDEPSCKVIIKNGRTGDVYVDEEMQKIKVLGSKNFFRYTWESSFPLKYKEFGKDTIIEASNPIKISLIKKLLES